MFVFWLPNSPEHTMHTATHTTHAHCHSHSHTHSPQDTHTRMALAHMHTLTPIFGATFLKVFTEPRP